jgi:N-hydroxyarylamine O-acetyltransferase
MLDADAAPLDLDAYLRRVDYRGDLAPTRATLAALHRAHATHIPFENLDILLGRPILLDLASLQAKLVAGRRGGYCFEQNLLFSTVLQALGFAVTQLAARVRAGSDTLRPRTHMTLRIDVEGTGWLADVGFGAAGPLLPVSFDGAESRQLAWAYRVVDADGQRVLQSCRGGPWEDLYAFTLEPQHRVDYELANHYTSTHPASPFTRIVTAQQIGVDARRVLRDFDYSEDRGSEVRRRTLADDAEMLAVLAGTFGLRLPAGSRLRGRDGTG